MMRDAATVLNLLLVGTTMAVTFAEGSSLARSIPWVASAATLGALWLPLSRASRIGTLAVAIALQVVVGWIAWTIVNEGLSEMMQGDIPDRFLSWVAPLLLLAIPLVSVAALSIALHRSR